jgi:hypothetical protein
MKNIGLHATLAAGLMLTGVTLTTAAAQADQCEKSFYAPEWGVEAPTVNAYSYVRAETDTQIKGYTEAPYNAFAKFAHGRKAYDVDHQVTLSANRDTIYSMAVFDLSKSPVSITLPETNGRYMSLMRLSQNNDVYPAIYAPAEVTLTLEEIGTRYIFVAVRTFADPGDPKDMSAAHALQDAIQVAQKDIGDPSGIPDWDQEQKMTLRKAFNAQASSFDNTAKLFGVKCDRSYFDNGMGVAVGWGGLQAKDAYYSPVQVPKNDGKTAYTITVPKDVPVDAFWSVTVYNQERYMVKNEQNRYAYNSVTTKKNDDGSVTIHFGGDPKADNYMPIMDGWLYLIRFYRPHQEILDGKWTLPAAIEVK